MVTYRRLICETCKKHIDRDIGARQGNITNLLSYGCDNHPSCDRDEIFNYLVDNCMDELNKIKKLPNRAGTG